MIAASASAPGKIILFGEHAVVYGQPALAAPVACVQATARVEPAREGHWIEARDIGRRYRLEAPRPNDPLAAAARLALQRLGLAEAPAFTLTVASSIPLASGPGSGAAVSTAIVRALAAAFGQQWRPAEVSALVFETERLLHGTPSGIDNTVIAYAQPVWFIKGQAPEPFAVGAPFQLLIADTGRPSPTRVTVGEVRAGWQREPERYEVLFQAIGALARHARGLIQAGQPAALGALMTRNHALLGELGVSSPELETLVAAAQTAGALGAKLSGGGRGGNLIALVTAETAAGVEAALCQAGAARVITTTIEKTPAAG